MKKRLRGFLFVFLTVLLLVSGFCHLYAALSPFGAEYLNQTAGAFVRLILGKATGWFPFSLAEIILAGSPVWVSLCIFAAVRSVRKRGNAKRVLAWILSFLTVFYALFVFTIGVGYQSVPLEEKLHLKNENATGEELYETALWLTEFLS
ncbi:MAG: DUF3810 family protein [Clostridia bacterium]|nr:DUF3810 family protein [Clostridia bacterium]